MSQPSDGNTNPAPATPPFFLTEGVSDLAMTYFYGHLFVALVSLGSVRNMSWSKYGEFLAFAVVLIVIPGPDFAVVTKNTLVGGRRRGRWTAPGVSNSNLVQGTAAAFGLNDPARTAQNMAGWRQGFISNVTNPKVLVFYLAVLPQFLTPGAGLGWLLGFGARLATEHV
jgi:threonine/homoserine/homoserine lactone efflux protein